MNHAGLDYLEQKPASKPTGWYVLHMTSSITAPSLTDQRAFLETGRSYYMGETLTQRIPTPEWADRPLFNITTVYDGSADRGQMYRQVGITEPGFPLFWYQPSV